jgi:SAM-dependent methyltransferase
VFSRRLQLGKAFDTLRRRRSTIDSRLEALDLLHTVSVARYQLRRTVEAAIEQYAKGDILEAGAGRSPYGRSLGRRSRSITRLDIDPAVAPDIIGDVQAMTAVSDSSFDTVVSTQVLEHVPDPRATVEEFYRVLRPGGMLILSAPHLSMVHEAPHDYFRFTRYALTHLCETGGFEVIEIHSVGGPLSFVGHSLSLGWLTTIGAVPGLFWPAWTTNYALLVRGLGFLDGLVGLPGLLPRDHLVVARSS